MANSPQLQLVEEALGYRFLPDKILNIESYFLNKEIYPDSYREVMSMEEEMVRDWHSGVAFLTEDGQVQGINLYDIALESKALEKLLNLELPFLQALNLNKTGITHFRFGKNMPALVHINLSQNPALKEVSFEENFAPEHLQSLDAYDSRISSLVLPKGLKELYKIDFARNQELSRLEFKGACPKLYFADLSDNALQDLHFPGLFEELTYLYLRGNQLAKLRFDNPFPKLDILDIRKNRLDGFHDRFHEMISIRSLLLSGNPLSDISEGVIPSEPDANVAKEVLDYLQSVNRSKTRANTYVKMIIVGNGRVGKTSMYKQLKGEDYDPDEKYTHGISIGELNEKNLPLEDGEEIILKVWDFGGQVIFHATHQFFLSQEALYILAWTDEDIVKGYRDNSEHAISAADEKWRKEESWLDNIRNLEKKAEKKSPILMVRTHTPDIYEVLEHLQVNKFKNPPYSASCLTFDAKTQAGLVALKKKIVEKLADMPIYGEENSNEYLNVLARISKMANELPFIDLARFTEICQEEGLPEASASSVRGFLNRTGVIVYLGNEERPLLNDIIFIDPNWLTKQVYRLINDDLKLSQGRINQKYLNGAFNKESEEEKERFIELLTQFELIFKSPDREGLYFAPQYLPEDPSDDASIIIDSEISKEEDLAFIFRFSKYLPENVMINFVCRYASSAHKGTIPWKNGIYFKFENQVNCLVIQDRETKELKVYIGSGEGHSQPAYQICKAFVDLSNNANAEISKDGQIFVDWEKLKEAQENKSEFVSGTKNERLQLREFFDLFEKGMERGLHDKKTTPEYDNRHIETDKTNNQNTMNELKQLVSEGRIDEALQKMEGLLPEHKQNELIMLKGRWNGFQAKQRQGVLGYEQENLQRNQITSSILNLIATISITISKPASSPETKEESTPKRQDQKKILFVAANPDDQTRVKTDQEHRILNAEYERGTEEKYLFLSPQFAVTIGQLQRALDQEPAIIHFSGHGGKDGIYITDDTNRTVTLGPSPMKRIFRRKREFTELVILNACFSASQAEIISSFEIYVIGANSKVKDNASVAFSKAFYSALGRGKSYEECYDEAIIAIGTRFPDEEEKFEAWYDGKKLDW